MINKSRFRISNDKKVLHKIGKRWVTVSALTLALLGGGAVASTTMTHADTINNQPKSAIVTNNLNKTLSKSASSNNVSSSTASASSKMSVSSNASSVSSSDTIQSASSNSTSNNSSSVGNIEAQASQLHKHMLNNSMNTLNLGTTEQQNRGWNFVQNGIRGNDYAPRNHSKAPRHLLGDIRKPILKDANTSYFSGSTKSDSYDGVHYKFWKNGGLEFTNGIAKGIDSRTGSNNFNKWKDDIPDVQNAKAIKFDSDVISDGGINPDNPKNSQSGPIGQAVNNMPSIQTLILNDKLNSQTLVNVQSDIDLQSVIFGDSYDTSKYTDIPVLFEKNYKLQSITFGKSFDTTHVTENNWQTGDMFGFLPSLQTITIKSSKTQIKSSVPTMYKEVGGSNANGPYTLSTPNDFSQGNVGTFTVNKNPAPLAVINYQSNGKTVSSYMTPKGTFGKATTANKLSNLPNGYMLNNPAQQIKYDGNTYDVPVTKQDTDTVAFYTKNGNDNVLVKKATVSGADGSSVDISKDVPSDYQLANGNPKITLTANTTDNVELNLKDGQSITNPYVPEKVTPDSANADVQYQYNHQTVNSDTTDYHGNNYQATDAGNNGTTINDKNDKGLPDGWHLAPTNTKTKSDTTYVKYDNGKHPVAIDPNHVSDNVIYQYNGKNVNNGYQLGSHSFGGNDYRATQAGSNGVDIKQGNATGLRSGYTLVNADNNIKFDGNTKYIPVKPNQINSTGTLTLNYVESNGRTDKTVTLHSTIKGNVDDTLTLAKPLDYAEDNYTVPNSDFTWTIKPSNNEPSKTFTYNAPTAGNVTIQYYDTATNHHLTQFDKTLTSSDMEKAPYNINWIVGNQIKLGIKGSNDKAIDVLQAPAGYHFAKNYPVEIVTLPEAKKGLTLHVGLMLMARPNKPASNANQPTSSASVAPSSNSNTSSSSSAVAPSSSSMPSSASTNSASISMNSSEVSNLASEIGANIVIRPNITDKTVDNTQNDTVLDDMASEIAINNQELSNLANKQQSNYSAPTTTNANPATVNITKHTTPKAINHSYKLPMKNHYYVYSPKNIILYGKHGAIKISRRKGFTGKIMKITKFHGKRAFVIRWHHKNFIVNAKHTRNAYIQPKEYNHYAHGIIKHATIKLRKNAIIYKSIHFNKHNAKHTVKSGNEFTVIGIKSFGEKGYERTRFILSNGLIITANKNYVKFI